MTTKSFRFDGAMFLGRGLSSSFSRAIATKDSLGQSIASGSPRYGRRSILCGAPVITAVSNATSGSWNVMATGVDADGSTPVLCLADITNLKLHVFKSAIVIDGSGNSTYKYDMSAGTSTYPDALKESADKLDGGAGALGDYNFYPKGGVCVHGRIDLLCSVAFRDAGPAWNRNRVGIMSCNVEDLAGAKTTWWRKAWIAPESPQCDTVDQTNMPGSWALQGWAAVNADGSAPTSYVIAPADYQSTNKYGGYLYMSVVSRPSTSSGTWTPGVFQQALTFARPTNTAHCHGGLVVPAADGSAKIVALRGDGHANNAMYTASIASLASYSTGSSAEGAGSYNSNSGGSGIGAMTIVNGRIGGLTGSPPATDDTVESARRYSSQPFAPQRGPGLDSIIIGSDEQHCAILMASSIPTSGGFTLTPVFRQARMYPVAGKASGSSNKLNTSRLCFQLITRAPNNPIPEVIANVTPQANQYQQASMCHGVYSPNGVEYGVCWNTGEPEQARPGFFGTSIIIGSPTGRGNGVRTIPIPAYLRGRPLLIDTGGKNYLATGTLTLTKSSGMTTDASSELNQTEALPASYTPAPGFGTPIYFATDAASGSSSAKFFATICNAGSALPSVTAGTTSHLLVQFAIHCAKVADWRSSGNGGVGSRDLAAPNSATDVGSNSCSQGFRFRLRLAGTDFTGYTENIYIAANDGTPHIITIPVPISAYKSYSANYTVDLYVESTSVATPIKGWLTPIGVYTTEQAPCPIAAGSTAPNTAFSLTGFSLPTTGFTAYWSGKVPTTPMVEMACAQSHTNTTSTTLSITNITAASPAVVTCNNHGLQNGDTVIISGSNSTPTLDGTRTVANATTNTFTVGVNCSGSGSAGTIYAPVITRLAGVSTGLDSVTDAFAGHRLFGVNSSTGAAFTDYGLAVASSVYISSGVHNLRHASRGGTTAGTYSQIDITMPSSTASAQPLFALANTDRSRIIAVYMDCLDGLLKVRYWNGSAWGSYATISGFFFVPECPVHVSLAYDGAGTLTMRASAGGSAISSTTLSVTPDQALTQLIAGDGTSVAPMEWWGGMVVESLDGTNEITSGLQKLTFTGVPLLTHEEIRPMGA